MFEAQKFHASLLKAGLLSHSYRCNLLLRAYVRCGALSNAERLLLLCRPNLVSFNTLLSGYICNHHVDDALQLFDAMPQRDARSWNSVISGLVQSHRSPEAVAHFVRMTRSNVRPDDFTYAIIVPCCDLGTGRQIHARIIKVCANSDPFVGTNLVRMYAGVGEMGDARKVFNGMPERDLVSWNVLVDHYSKFGMGELCIQLFREMVRDGIRPDEFTFATAFNEFARCGDVSGGMQVHSLIIRSGFCSDRFACNALLNMYSKWDFANSVTRLFGDMPERNVVSWTTVITGLVASGQEGDAFEAFHWMRMAEVEPNSYTFGSLISSCANASALEKGKQYHALTLKYGLELDVVLGSSIVDMYSKCGEMNDALRLFEILPERDVVSWNVMICGLAQNGEAMKALKLFDEMVQLNRSDVIPNQVTFVGVLSACSHGGFIHKGCSFFSDMGPVYSIEPQSEHYACLVDLLARAGLLGQAEAIILASPFKHDVVMWGALLAACRTHRSFVIAKRVAEILFVGEPMNSSNYVLLANMHAADRQWDDALEVRGEMSTHGAHKVMGNSWIEIRGQIHTFTSGYVHHPQFELLCDVLQCLSVILFEEGYRFDLIHEKQT